MMAFIGWLTIGIAQGVICYAAANAYMTYLDRREPRYAAVWRNRPQ